MVIDIDIFKEILKIIDIDMENLNIIDTYMTRFQYRGKYHFTGVSENLALHRMSKIDF